MGAPGVCGCGRESVCVPHTVRSPIEHRTVQCPPARHTVCVCVHAQQGDKESGPAHNRQKDRAHTTPRRTAGRTRPSQKNAHGAKFWEQRAARPPRRTAYRAPAAVLAVRKTNKAAHTAKRRGWVGVRSPGHSVCAVCMGDHVRSTIHSLRAWWRVAIFTGILGLAGKSTAMGH